MFSFVKFIIGWPISIVALFFIGKFFLPHLTPLISTVYEIKIALLLYSILSFFIYFFLRTYLWKEILKAKGHNLSLRESAYLWGTSELKRYVPGKVWGFLSRTILFSEKQISKSVIFSSIVIEAQLVLLGSLIVSIFSLPFIFKSLFPGFNYDQVIIYIVILGSLFLALLYIFGSYFLKKFSFLKTFSPTTNFYHVSLSVVAFLFFGLGSYLSIASLFTLSPKLLVEFISLFVFSLLLGYISLVTPMGLGIREGTITIAISKFLQIQAASFASIFTRIIFIISELLFLALTYFWAKTKNSLILKIEHILKNNKQEAILAGLIIVYAIYFVSVSFLRFDNFYTGRYDLGNMDQAVWNTVNGRIFQTSSDYFGNIGITSRLSSHADFILILLAPFYLIWDSPKMLLLLQAIILACGAIPLFLIAKKVLKNKNIALVFAFIFLVNPAVNFTNLYDFHPTVLATTFLLAAFYCLLSNKYGLFLLFAILSGLTKENIWIIISLIGGYVFIKNIFTRSWKFKVLGIAIFIISFSVFYYLTSYAIPNARGSNHFALTYYSEFGESPDKIIKNVAFSPYKVISTIIKKDRLDYLYKIFSPLGYLSLLSPLYLVFIAPDLLIKLLSNNSNLYQIYNQYSAGITPFVFISAIFGIKIVRKLFPQIPMAVFIAYLLFFTFRAYYSFGPLPGSKNPNIDMFIKPQKNREIIRNALFHIDEKYSVSATNNLGAHLSHRQVIYTVPVGVEKTDFVAFLLNDPFAQPSLQAQKDMVKKLRNDQQYSIFFEKEDFIVFKKIVD